MANELTLSGGILYQDADGTVASRVIDSLVKSTGSKAISKGKLAVSTSETTVPIPTGTRGYCVLVNKDITSTIDVKTGASGTIFARLDVAPAAGMDGGFCVLKLGSGAQSPVAISSSLTPLMEFLIFVA